MVFRKFIQSAFKAATNIDELLETIDNIFDFLTSGKVWESISSFFIKMREELSDIDLADIDLVKASYILGFGIVFIAGFFIPLTALAKVGKVGSLGAKFSEMLTEVGKVVRAFPEAMKSKTAIQQLNRLLDVFSSSEKTRHYAGEITQAIKKWLVKNKDLLSPKYKEIADLTSKELDWMASRKIGNLGGNILKSIQIRKLRGILKQKGIILIVDGDVKNIVKLFKPIDNFKSFEELTLFMKNNNKVGLFHAGTKQMILTKNCTEIVAFHEMCHLKHFEEVGEIAYKGFSTIKKEMYV
ncbi:zincin-like metallopeptidase toxin domain-containing protein [Empedobacter brevis]|uniref:zincin-like metallopeptidase toxin domain-containing protein n=1 Tax=Empedobacter brevis TaxID=247 RepID=UPI0028AF22FE|nr:zincin-like metallopeptidase toxin domain-containing protein [Empedobacter brevis]